MTGFETIAIESGAAAYAEPFDPASFLKMPANALVNGGYLVLALYWLLRLRRQPASLRTARPFFVALALMAFGYGLVQFGRIVTQARAFGIADQWVTLPFFALVFAWSLDFLGAKNRRLLVSTALFASTLSYGLVLVHPRGFEVALAVHIALVVGGCLATMKAVDFANLGAFVAALVACLAFVFLKQHDLALAALPWFQRFTGHFWSKVGDISQLHFVLVFFEQAYLAREPRTELAVA